MTKQTDTDRAVTETDLQIVEHAIANHEIFQRHLFTLQRVLTEIGALNIAGLRSTAIAEQSRLDEARAKADAATAELAQLEKQIQDKKHELAEVEVTIKERIAEGERYSSATQNLRALLVAA